jgi:hypothetical protein
MEIYNLILSSHLFMVFQVFSFNHISPPKPLCISPLLHTSFFTNFDPYRLLIPYVSNLTHIERPPYTLFALNENKADCILKQS